MNASPSPSQPNQAPASELANIYAKLLVFSQQALIHEQDLSKREKLTMTVAFFNRAVSEEMELAAAAGAPVPQSPLPPQMPQPQAAPPPAAMGAPQAAPGMPIPGGMAGPSLPGAQPTQ